MTVRDVLVQIGFLMVTAGAMLAAWAVLTGQFRRGAPPEPEVRDEEPEPAVQDEEPGPDERRPVRARTPRPRKPATPRKAAPRKPAPRKASPRKPRRPA